jgi:hypothetical protein
MRRHGNSVRLIECATHGLCDSGAAITEDCHVFHFVTSKVDPEACGHHRSPDFSLIKGFVWLTHHTPTMTMATLVIFP